MVERRILLGMATLYPSLVNSRGGEYKQEIKMPKEVKASITIASCGHEIADDGNFYALEPFKYGVYCDACMLKILEGETIRLAAALYTLKEMVQKGRYYRVGSFINDILEQCIKRVIE
jgi:hypothetical protein